MLRKSNSDNFIYILILLIPNLVLSCNQSGTGSKNENRQVYVRQVDTIPVAAPDDMMKRGEEVYARVCLACHQADGSGVPMMFPPIRKSDIISGGHEKLIILILEGMSGPVEINGDQYNSVMPPQKDNLDDHQIADLVYFLRNTFGNRTDSIPVEEVARLRK